MTGTTPGDDTSTQDNPPQSMVARMTVIMDCFADRTARLRLDQIADRTALPRSTCHRILEQLVRLRWLRHTQGGYALGQRALQLAGVVGNHDELRAAAVPVLEDLAARTGMVAILGVLDFAEVVYLDRIGPAKTPGMPTRVGARAPAYAVATGKAMLAWLPAEEADALLDGALRARTRNTITDLLVMHEELRRIRSRHGLAFEREEATMGVCCVGAAVRGPEGPVAGIALCTQTTSANQLDRYAPLVLDAARRTALRLYPEIEQDDRPSTMWSDGMMERILQLIDDDTLM